MQTGLQCNLEDNLRKLSKLIGNAAKIAYTWEFRLTRVRSKAHVKGMPGYR